MPSCFACVAKWGIRKEVARPLGSVCSCFCFLLSCVFFPLLWWSACVPKHLKKGHGCFASDFRVFSPLWLSPWLPGLWWHRGSWQRHVAERSCLLLQLGENKKWVAKDKTHVWVHPRWPTSYSLQCKSIKTLTHQLSYHSQQPVIFPNPVSWQQSLPVHEPITDSLYLNNNGQQSCKAIPTPSPKWHVWKQLPGPVTGPQPAAKLQNQ